MFCLFNSILLDNLCIFYFFFIFASPAYSTSPRNTFVRWMFDMLFNNNNNNKKKGTASRSNKIIYYYGFFNQAMIISLWKHYFFYYQLFSHTPTFYNTSIHFLITDYRDLWNQVSIEVTTERVFPGGHPSKHWPNPTLLNFTDETAILQ